MEFEKILNFFNLPKDIICDKETLTDKYARIYISPFDKGIATTIGNSLRRFLLSSIPGYAISAVKIEGLYHEFTSIEGTKEDFTDFVLNLKQVKLKLLSEEPKKEVFISLTGEGIFKAGDLSKFDSDIVVTNPELELLHLNEDANLRIKLVITYGKGAILAEEFKDIEEVGLIPIDAIYSPVIKVNFDVDQIRIGNKTLERVILDIETDGTIYPIDAYKIACQLFNSHLKNLDNIQVTKLEKAQSDSNVVEIREIVKKLSSSIDELNLSAKIANILKESGITRVYDLVSKHEEELKFRSFGKKSIDEVKEKLKEWGLSIGMYLPKEVIKEFED